jgi:hypothetical protein
MKAFLAPSRSGAPAKRRLIDELIELLRRWEAELRQAFGWRRPRFDPGDPRLLTVVLAVLAAYLAAVLLYAWLGGRP